MTKLLFNNSKKVSNTFLNCVCKFLFDIYLNISFNLSKAEEFKAKSSTLAFELSTNN